jgi:hypothetical protein
MRESGRRRVVKQCFVLGVEQTGSLWAR